VGRSECADGRAYRTVREVATADLLPRPRPVLGDYLADLPAVVNEAEGYMAPAPQAP